MESDKVEIIDFSGEKFTKISIPCSANLVLILIFVTLNIFLPFLFPGSLISIFLSLIILCIYCIYYSYTLTKNPGIRKFSISLEEIEIIIPQMPAFLISRSEFKKLEIRLRKLDIKPFLIYTLHFINSDSERTVKISLSEFSKEKIEQILKLLKIYVKRMGKEFIAVKETWVSGVLLVENLKIDIN
ncbi:MAG: hypothetical protein ACFE9Q_07930 [Candidatus Hodarchaeota archaeon]